MSRQKLLDRAEALRVEGHLERAAEVYRQYLLEAPADVEVRKKRAELLTLLASNDGAISEYFKIQETLMEGGDLLGAIAAGRRISQLDPSLSNPLSYVAQVQMADLEKERKLQGPDTVPFEPVQRLPDIPLLADLLPDELTSVSRNLLIHEMRPGETVFEESDPGDSLFFVTRGLLEVQAGDRLLGQLRAGDCFGEFSFLTAEPRTATVRVVEEAELLELRSLDMQQVIDQHPRVRDVLFQLYRERAMENVLARSPLFEIFGEEARRQIASDLELVSLPLGATVFRQGSGGGSIYLIKKGQVEVRAQVPGGAEIRLATLGPHQFFGEVSFLTGVPRTATITTLSPCELLRLDEGDLRGIVGDHPELQRVLERYHLDRVMATAEALKAFLRKTRVDGVLR
jgi:CRP-like cAMP-binding protein